MVLAAAGIVAGVRGRPVGGGDARALVWALLASALALVVLSLGPYAEVLGLPFARLWEAVPGLRYYRVPLRFAFFVSLPVAILGGFAAAALASLAARRAGRSGVWLATAALVAAACSQGPRGPLPLSPFGGQTNPPAVYEWLSRQPCDGDRCAVLEVPVGPDWDQDPVAVYRTLAHEHPAVNGYSGFAPAAYPLVVSLAAQLPEAAARVALGALTGARWLVVHRARLTVAERRAWDAAALPETARFGDDVVYEIPVMDLDWRAAYLTPPPDATFAGTPLAPLPAGSRADVRLNDAFAVAKREPFRVETEVTNAGDAPWPALTSRARDRVTLTLTWRGARGPIPTLPVTTVYLPTDLGAGQRARLAARLRAPARPGTYVLEARVVQEGRPPLPGAARATVRVAP